MNALYGILACVRVCVCVCVIAWVTLRVFTYYCGNHINLQRVDWVPKLELSGVEPLSPNPNPMALFYPSLPDRNDEYILMMVQQSNDVVTNKTQEVCWPEFSVYLWYTG